MTVENPNPENQTPELDKQPENPNPNPTPPVPSSEKTEDNGYQKRIDKLTWRTKQFERELQERDRKIAEYENRFKTLEEKVNPREFKNDAEKLDFYINSKVEEKLTQEKSSEAERKAYEEKASKISSNIQKSMELANKMYPDAQDVIQSHTDPLPANAFSFILKSDVSGPMSYKIAKSPEIQEKINSFDDEDDLKRYLTKLELKVESEVEAWDLKQKEAADEAAKTKDETEKTFKPMEKIDPKNTKVKSKDPDPATNLSDWIKMRNEAEMAKKKRERGLK